MMYSEDDYLMLSGLQHFVFCRRQWALIHIENLWEENLRTVEGNLMHEKAHDSSFCESRGDLYILRGVSIHSSVLGVSGKCDVLEYHRQDTGISLKGKEGLWQPYPVEYKKGEPKDNPADRLQLCGQAMCLEEMLCCDIPEGALFYGETRRREVVEFTSEMRRTVREHLMEMHDYYKHGHTPKVKPTKSCNACSLKELCLPKLLRQMSVKKYIAEALEATE
ncbi:MAG: CRISPR-associated protein Cas4 [Clostridia bacterium]|nr:CRISPR-associated protein Cas4 [Clostridia bacterium]MBR4000247.1 CRISPR-associated protein Cas4 [Clostridia bacterium]